MNSVTVVPYDPNWDSLFRTVEKEIRAACGMIPLILFHIGSTSIPKMAAKPVIDLLAEVADLDDIDACSDALRSIGFEALGEYGIAQRRFFKRLPQISFPCPIHLHVYAAGDPQIGRHLRFRDYLRAYPRDAQKYEELKQALASIYAKDRDAYTDNKNKLIQELDRKALFWKPISPYRHLDPTPRQKKWSQEKILSSLEANLFFHLTYLIRYVPDAEYLGRNFLSWVTAPIKDCTFNYAFHSPDLREKEADSWIDQTIAHFQKKNLPFSWWVSPRDHPKNLTEKLRARNFCLAESYKGMYTPLPHSISTAPPLSIERVSDTAQLADFCSVWEKLGLSQELYPKIWNQIPSCLYQKGAPVEIYVGYRTGLPVATGLLAFYAGIAGIYWIGTSPSEQRQGNGLAMLSHLLLRAQSEKYSVAALLAVSSAKSFYQKAGFHELADFYEFEYESQS